MGGLSGAGGVNLCMVTDRKRVDCPAVEKNKIQKPLLDDKSIYLVFEAKLSVTGAGCVCVCVLRSAL